MVLLCILYKKNTTNFPDHNLRFGSKISTEYFIHVKLEIFKYKEVCNTGESKTILGNFVGPGRVITFRSRFQHLRTMVYLKISPNNSRLHFILLSYFDNLRIQNDDLIREKLTKKAIRLLINFKYCFNHFNEVWMNF